MRILIGGLVGGIVMFIWGGVAHNVLKVSSAAFSETPNEVRTMETLAGLFPESGLYVFPNFDMTKKMEKEEEEAFIKRHRQGPVGLVLIDRDGREPMTPRLFIVEFLSNTLAALAAAFIASLLVGGYGKRVLAIGLLGVVGWASISVSSWNWFAYPTATMTGEAIEQIIGWLLVALAIAKVVPAAGSTT